MASAQKNKTTQSYYVPDLVRPELKPIDISASHDVTYTNQVFRGYDAKQSQAAAALREEKSKNFRSLRTSTVGDKISKYMPVSKGSEDRYAAFANVKPTYTVLPKQIERENKMSRYIDLKFTPPTLVAPDVTSKQTDKAKQTTQVIEFFSNFARIFAQSFGTTAPVQQTQKIVGDHKSLVKELELEAKQLEEQASKISPNDVILKVWADRRKIEITNILNRVQIAVAASEEDFKVKAQELLNLQNQLNDQKELLNKHTLTQAELTQKIDALDKTVAGTESTLLSGQIETGKTTTATIQAEIEAITNKIVLTENDLNGPTIQKKEDDVRKAHEDAAAQERANSVQSLKEDIQNLKSVAGNETKIRSYQRVLEVIENSNEFGNSATIKRIISLLNTTEQEAQKTIAAAQEAVSKINSGASALSVEAQKKIEEQDLLIKQLQEEAKQKEQRIQLLESKGVTDDQVKRLAELERQVVDQQKQLGNFQKDNNNYQTLVDLKEAEIRKANQDLAAKQKQYDDFKAAVDAEKVSGAPAFATQLKELEQQRDAFKLASEKAISENQTTQELLKKSVNSKEFISAALSQNLLEKDELKKFVGDAAVGEINNLKEQVEALKLAAEQAAEMKQTLTKTVERLGKEIELANETIEEMKKSPKGLSESQVKERIDNYLKTVQSVIKTATGEDVVLTQEDGKLAASFTKLKDSLAKPYKLEIDKKIEELKVAKKELEDLATGGTTATKAIQDKLDAANTKVKELEASVKTKAGLYTELDKKFTALKGEHDQIKASISKAVPKGPLSMITGFFTGEKSLSQAIADMEKMDADQKKQVAEAIAAQKKAENSMSEAVLAKDTATGELAGLKTQFATVVAEKGSLTTALNKKLGELTEAQNKLAEATVTITSLEAKFKTTEEALKLSNAQITVLETVTLEEQKKKIETLQKKVDTLEETAKKVNEEVYKTEIAKLEAIIQNREEMIFRYYKPYVTRSTEMINRLQSELASTSKQWAETIDKYQKETSAPKRGNILKEALEHANNAAKAYTNMDANGKVVQNIGFESKVAGDTTQMQKSILPLGNEYGGKDPSTGDQINFVKWQEQTEKLNMKSKHSKFTPAKK